MDELNQTILNARHAIENIEKCEKMAEIFKVLGDAGRLKVVKALTAGELCASDIALALNLENSVVSHQPVKTFKNLTRESIVETLRILLNFILPPLLCF